MLIGFTGDLFLGNAPLEVNTFSQVSAGLPPDVGLIINFEGTLYEDPLRLRAARQKVLLESPTNLLPLLEQLPISIASIGNNHIGDYGNDVARETLDHLRPRFPVFGAGLEPDDFHLATQAFGGVEVGFVNYCTADTSPLFCDQSRIGPRKLNLRDAATDLRLLKSRARHCVAIVHWGYEDFHHPRPVQRRLGRALIEMGFNLVIGHHSHTAQGYEKYRDGWIFYSLGNFFFPDHSVQINGRTCSVKWMPRRSWGLVPFFAVTQDRLLLQTVRIVGHRRNRPPQWNESRRLRTKFDRLCRHLCSDRYVQSYRSFCKSEAWRIRWEEFLNNEEKLGAVLRKLKRTLWAK